MKLYSINDTIFPGKRNAHIWYIIRTLGIIPVPIIGSGRCAVTEAQKKRIEKYLLIDHRTENKGRPKGKVCNA